MTNPPRRYPAPANSLESSCATLAGVPESAALLRVRVLPAEFARMVGVSKQTVSRWIRDQKITINVADGRLDPQQAVRQVLRNTDPGRLRSRVLLQAIGDVGQIRAELATRTAQAERLSEQLSISRAAAASAKADLQRVQSLLDASEDQVDAILDALVLREPELRESASSAEWFELAFAVVYPNYDPNAYPDLLAQAPKASTHALHGVPQHEGERTTHQIAPGAAEAIEPDASEPNVSSDMDDGSAP